MALLRPWEPVEIIETSSSQSNMAINNKRVFPCRKFNRVLLAKDLVTSVTVENHLTLNFASCLIFAKFTGILIMKPFRKRKL